MGLFGSKTDINSVELVDKATDNLVEEEIKELKNIHKYMPLLQGRIDSQIKMLQSGEKGEKYILTKLQSKMDGKEAELGFPVKLITNLQVDYNIRSRDAAQIDMLMITPKGFICLEIKNRKNVIRAEVKDQDIILTIDNRQLQTLKGEHSPIRQNNIHINALKNIDFKQDKNKRLLERSTENIGSCVVYVDADRNKTIFVIPNDSHVTNDKFFFTEIKKIYSSLPDLRLSIKDMDKLCESIVEYDKKNRRMVNLEKYQRLATLCIKLTELHKEQIEKGITGSALINRKDIAFIIRKCTSSDGYLMETVSDKELSNEGKFEHNHILDIKEIIEKCKQYTPEQLKAFLDEKLMTYEELEDSYADDVPKVKSEPLQGAGISENTEPVARLICFGCNKPLSLEPSGICCKNQTTQTCKNIKLGFVYYNGKRINLYPGQIKALFYGKQTSVAAGDGSRITVMPEICVNKGYTNWIISH